MAEFGVLGLGVMGSNLALNVLDHGISVAVWNRKPAATDAFVREAGRRVTATKSLEELVGALERPRRILMMIQAGKPIDAVLEQLRPLLDAGDIVIDGGNSWFEDTRRREKEYAGHDLHFVGMGISGGAKGARSGPSLMPGGSRHAWTQLQPTLEAIAAVTESGPCVTHVGPDGAGHFVKMVHNGIEYADMQLIAEVYDVLRRGLGLAADRIATILGAWNEGALASFLIEITAKLLTVKDQDGAPLVDKILDHADQKGTGRWTASLAIDLGVPAPTIAAAVDARVLSSMKDERVAAEKKLRGPTKKSLTGDPEKWIAAAADALLMARIVAYAQGLHLIRAGSEEHRWKIDLKEIARIWKGGCIIRSALLDDVMTAFATRRPPANLLVARGVKKALTAGQRALRKLLAGAQSMGIATPSLSASLAYYDSYRTANLPQNLTQAQRDAFGSHTYRRADRPEEGPTHTDWLD